MEDGMPETLRSVDDYVAAAPSERQATLRRLRALIFSTVPGARETIQSGMPFYEYNGMLCAFAAQKRYFSFYVLNGAIVEAHKGLLAGLDVGKGCIRFRRDEQLPDETIRTLLEAAAAANRAAPNDHC
jgi:hypothetical protein